MQKWYMCCLIIIAEHLSTRQLIFSAIIQQQLMTTHTYLHEAAPTNYDLVHEAYIVQMQITCMRYKQEFVTIGMCNSIWFLLPTHLSSVQLHTMVSTTYHLSSVT